MIFAILSQPSYLCQVGDDLSTLYSSIVIFINQQRFNHHKNLQEQTGKLEKTDEKEHFSTQVLKLMLTGNLDLPCGRMVEPSHQVCREYDQ